jgi:cell wall-associated NlpC family hydrolase
VGVYIGNGKFIHAATSSVKSKRSWVRIADINDFRKRIDKIIRPPELL